jgi:hypothetical protein
MTSIKHRTKHNNTTNFTLAVSLQSTLCGKIYTYLDLLEVGDEVTYDDMILEIFGEINDSTRTRFSAQLSRALRFFLIKDFRRYTKKRTIERLI